MENIFYLVIAMFLVLLNAFFVAAEFGLVKLRATRVETIKKSYGWRGAILSNVHQQLDAYLSACQLGITLASLGLGWIGEPAFARLLTPLFQYFNIHEAYFVHALSFLIAFFVITFLHIVIGELLPKSIAIRQAEVVALWTSFPLYLFNKIMYPIIWIMNISANALLKLFRIRDTTLNDFSYSSDELKLIVSGSYVHGALEKIERNILEHTIDLAELKVPDIMRPIEDMIVLNTNQSVDEALDMMSEHRYSRYPVYDALQDKIIGIVHIKDIFANYYQHQEKIDFKECIRPVLKVSRRLPALELLRKFREGMPHFALVYTGKEENLIGFLTLDNLLHFLVGRIKDEFHLTQDDWILNQDGSYTLRGNTSIYALERALDIDIEDEDIEDDVDTINGLLTAQLGAIPKTGQVVEFKQFTIRVKKMRGPKVLLVNVSAKNNN